MTIQGTGMIAAMQQSGYFSSSNFATQNQNGSQGGTKGVGGPGGPRGKGGPPPQKNEPNVDTDDDGLWSSSEISDFSEALGLNLDVSEIMSKYDVDGDGGISSGERESLGKDNALNLPRPEELMQMRGEILGEQSETGTAQTAQDMFGEAMQAYMNSTKYQEEIVSILDVAL